MAWRRPSCHTFWAGGGISTSTLAAIGRCGVTVIGVVRIAVGGCSMSESVVVIGVTDEGFGFL